MAVRITFEDERDFLEFASRVIGAVYSYTPDAMARIERGSFFGKVKIEDLGVGYED